MTTSIQLQQIQQTIAFQNIEGQNRSCIQSSKNQKISNENTTVDLGIGSQLTSRDLIQWLSALDQFSKGRLSNALKIFKSIQHKSSKICYNIGSIYSVVGDHLTAISCFELAVKHDNYMAITFFQIGVSHFLSGSYEKAALSFNNALRLMRGNSVINYQQLGLNYKLYSCEIMYNRALSYFYSGQVIVGIHDLGFAVKEKRYIPEHDILDEALKCISETREVQLPCEEGYKRPKKSSKRLSTVPSPKKQILALSSLTRRFKDISVLDLKPNNKRDWDSTNDKAGSFSLFSVPQVFLFSPIDTMVQSTLGEKSMEICMARLNLSLQSSRKGSYWKEFKPVKSHQIDYSTFERSPLVPTRRSSIISSDHLKANVRSDSRDAPSKNLEVSTKTLLSEKYIKSPRTASLLSDQSLTPVVTINNLSANYNNKAHRVNPDSDGSSKSQKFQNVAKLEDEFNEAKISPQFTASSNNGFTNEVPPPVKYPRVNPQKPSRLFMETSKVVSERSRKSPEEAKISVEMLAPPAQWKGFTSTDSNSSLDGTSDSALSFPMNDTQSFFQNDSAIKIKIQYGKKDNRVIMVQKDIMFQEFKGRIASKIQPPQDPNSLYLRVKDEDGDLVMLGDQEDLSMAFHELCTKTSSSKSKLLVFVEGNCK